MGINQFFGNVSWDNVCVYNVDATGKGGCQGTADIEHHHIVEGETVVWTQADETPDLKE